MKRSISLILALMLVFNLCCIFSITSYGAEDDSYIIRCTIRDFDPVNSRYPERNHPDFENEKYFNTSTTGAVKANLGSDNTPVYASSGYSVKIITSADSFYDWYHDTDKNINIPYDLVLKKSGSLYTFDSTLTDGFFPINNKGFGNYQNNKNYHFTLELHAKFIFKSGLKFNIIGDDDVWLFVNKKIVGDMGGIHEAQTKNINMDDYKRSMNLNDGDECTLDLFFAERHITESNLKISTNISLVSADEKTNKAPIADAGDDISLKTSSKTVSVKLDGSGSKDPDGGELSYIWKNGDGDIVSRDVKPTITLPVGTHTFTLTVSDGEGSDTDKVEVEVKEESKSNAAPVANAGSNQTKTTSGTRATVTLDGSKSTDPDGDTLTYRWTDEDGDRIASTVKPQVELPVGVHKIKLTVSDGKLSDTDTVIIEIKDADDNREPAANAGTDQEKITTGTKSTVTLDGSKSTDPDGDDLTYKWTDEDENKIATGENPKVELPVGRHKIKLTVSDGDLSDTDSVIIDISKASSIGNSRPVADAGSDKTVQTYDGVAEITLDGSKSYDPDDDSLTYSWEDESGKVIGSKVKPKVLLEDGTHVITLTVSDGSLTDTDKVTITVEGDEIPSSSGASADLGIALEADVTKVEEKDEITFTIKYANKTEYTIPDIEVDFKLADDMEVVDAANGKVLSSKIVWNIGDLAAKKSGQMKIKVQTSKINEAEVIKNVVASIGTSGVELSNTYDDESKLDVMVYSNRYTQRHTRYILGYPDNTFKGERNITRAETAVIFARIMDLKDLKINNTTKFVDVAKGFWAENHIYAAVQIGLFKGVDSTHFNPDVPITRAEFATVIANYLKISRTSEEVPLEYTFNDIENHWAQGNIEEIARYKIVTGYSDGSFKPQKKILRQEAVVMINHMLYRGPLTNVTSSFPDMPNGHWAFGDVEEAVRSHEFVINDGNEEMTKFIDDPIW